MMTSLQYNEFLKSLLYKFSDDDAYEILDALEYQYQQGWNNAENYHFGHMK